jgi:hypothetical protein
VKATFWNNEARPLITCTNHRHPMFRYRLIREFIRQNWETWILDWTNVHRLTRGDDGDFMRHPFVQYKKKWKQKWPRKNPGRKGAKIGLYFRRKTKAHNLESVTGLHGSQISPLRVSKQLLNVCSGCSGAAQAVIGLWSGRAQGSSPRLRVAHPQLRLRRPLLTSAD